MVRLSDAGSSVPMVSRLLGLHEQTVRQWIKAFLSGGFDALHNKPRGGTLAGKVSRLTPAMIEALRQEIKQGKRTWTARQMADWLAQSYGVRLSARRVSVHMKRAGLVYKRTNRSLKHKQKTDEVAAGRSTLQMLKGGPKAD